MSNKLLGKAQESLHEIHHQFQGSPAQRPYTGYFGSITACCGIPLLLSEMCCLSSARRLRACRSRCRSTQPMCCTANPLKASSHNRLRLLHYLGGAVPFSPAPFFWSQTSSQETRSLPTRTPEDGKGLLLPAVGHSN